MKPGNWLHTADVTTRHPHFYSGVSGGSILAGFLAQHVKRDGGLKLLLQ